jgi:two-component system response regulator HydG
MAPPLTLLLAAHPPRQWRLPESLLAGRFRLEHAGAEHLEGSLRHHNPDAALVWAACFQDHLARDVKRWKTLRPKTQFLLFLDAPPPTRAVVSLLHAGFHDVLDSPQALDMGAVLDSLAERLRFVRLGQLERLQAKQSMEYAGLVGESPEMVKVYDQMLRAARLNCPVLVLGETGAGKGLVAHAIHALSPRNGKPFVTVDCGCLAPTLIESELYGVARGAFTGAVADRSGLVEAAQHGTLFLDEVGELPLALQPKLLRLLEEGEVRRLGSHRTTPVDVRVVSATAKDLDALISTEQFRLDLYYRLNVLSIELPPLRQRPQDVPLLARHFASRHLAQGAPITVSEAALEVLAGYPWPGNVRELKNCIEAAIAAANGSIIQPHHIAWRYTPPARPDATPPVNLKDLERRAILRALELTNHDKLRAAQLLGIGKTTLYRKLKTLGVSEPPATYVM